MGKRRPINRRPWRRAPWKVQWRDFSYGVFDRENDDDDWTEAPCAIPRGPVECETFDDTGTTTVRYIWAGPADAEHLDDNTCTIQRIVGSIDLRFYSPNPSGLLHPVVRLGVLHREEIPPDGTTLDPRINLWDDAHLEDFQWMWLHQAGWDNIWTAGPEATDLNGSVRIPVDIRVKRKLSRRDGIALLASFVVPATSPGAIVFGTEVDMYPMLRVLQGTR